MSRAIAFIDPSVSTENVGDLFIVDSIRRILKFDESRSIRIDPRKPITQEHIDSINRTDAAVITGTNLWYRQMARPGRWTFTIDDLKKIKVPIIPLGVGTTRHYGDDNAFDPDTAEQIRLIHASCKLGSARDPRTVEALNEAGIKNVAMTGCPTMFRSLSPTWSLKQKQTKKVVVTVRHGQKANVRLLVKQLAKAGLDPVVAAQQDKDNFLTRSIPLVQKSVPTLYEYDIAPYTKLIDESIGAIGWRLHGNMIHLAHGNPAVLFSNCSRGDSFCDAFALPRIQCPDHHQLTEPEVAQQVQKLLDPATFEKLPARYREYRASMARFLTENALDHNLA